MGMNSNYLYVCLNFKEWFVEEDFENRLEWVFKRIRVVEVPVNLKICFLSNGYENVFIRFPADWSETGFVSRLNRFLIEKFSFSFAKIVVCIESWKICSNLVSIKTTKTSKIHLKPVQTGFLVGFLSYWKKIQQFSLLNLPKWYWKNKNETFNWNQFDRNSKDHLKHLQPVGTCHDLALYYSS